MKNVHEWSKASVFQTCGKFAKEFKMIGNPVISRTSFNVIEIISTQNIEPHANNWINSRWEFWRNGWRFEIICRAVCDFTADRMRDTCLCILCICFILFPKICNTSEKIEHLVIMDYIYFLLSLQVIFTLYTDQFEII